MRYPIIALLTACLGAAGAHSATAPPLTVEEVISAVGFDAEQRADLLAGEIVTMDTDEGSDKEMSILVALKTPVPLLKVWDFWQQVRILEEPRVVQSLDALVSRQRADDARSVLALAVHAQ